MRWLLISHLKNEFGQIGFNDLNAERVQGAIQTNFFRRHALALHHEADARFTADFGDITGRIGGGGREMEMASVPGNTGFERREQLRQARQGIFLDGARLVFKRLVVGDGRGRGIAAAIERLRVVPHGRALHLEGHANGREESRLIALVGDGAW